MRIIMNKIQIKINKALPGFRIGQSLTIEVDDNGLPLIKFWRDRLKDSEIDGCIEVVKQKKAVKQKGNEE